MATAPVNLHLSFDRLAAIVRHELEGDPKADTLVVFHNRRRTHLKMLWHDGNSYRLLYTRLDRGSYRIPMAIPEGARRISVNASELALILEGVDRAKLRLAKALARGPLQESSSQGLARDR